MKAKELRLWLADLYHGFVYYGVEQLIGVDLGHHFDHLSKAAADEVKRLKEPYQPHGLLGHSYWTAHIF